MDRSTGRVGNSTQRFPELSISLPMGCSTGRVVGSKTHIIQVFRQIYIKI